MSYSVLIPAYNPDETLTKIVDNLLIQDIENIIVVNDGSKDEKIFKDIAQRKRVRVITHPFNLGKGRALKNGLNFYVASKKSDSAGVVTADCDGQHLVKDIVKIGRLLHKRNAVIMGVRDFSSKEVPLKSKYGNLLTCNIFTFLTGLSLKDTQCGLRGIPVDYVEFFKDLQGERFDFELNMLLCCKKNRILIYEEPVNTVYINNNSSSKFHPVYDSMKIYSTLLGINKLLKDKVVTQMVTFKAK